MKRGQKLVATLAFALPIAMTTPVFADATTTTSTTTTTTATATVNDAFTKQYQKNLQAEATLLTQAQAKASTSTQPAQLVTAAQSIQQQAASLFAVEQSMAAMRTSIPKVTAVNADTLKKLQAQRNTLVRQINTEADALKHFNNGNGKGKEEREEHGKKDKHSNNTNSSVLQLQKLIATQLGQLAKLDSQIAKAQFKDDDKNNYGDHPFDGGFKELQDSIVRLQASVGHYLKQAIWLEGQAAMTTTLTAPTSLAVSNQTSTGATVSWAAVPGATSYNVYQNGQKVASKVTGTSFAFNNLTSSTTYTVTVTSVDATNLESAASAPLSITTTAPVAAIGAPTGLSLTNITSNSISVSWSAVQGATSYNVYLNGYKVANAVSGTSYTMGNLNPSSTYTFSVTAVGSGNTESQPSASLQGTTLAAHS